jgi:PhnB protein
MAVQPYINFSGNCREAVEFYAKVFGTEKPQIMSFGDTPPDPGFPLSEETRNLVMHAELKIEGTTIMFSDIPPGMPFTARNNISLMVGSKDINKVKAYFQELKIGGTVMMDLQETFWSKCYGNLTDKFGIGWQLNYDSGETAM